MRNRSYRIDELLTVEELAAKMKVSVRTIRDWIRRRRIPFTRFQRRVYFQLGVVEELLERNAVVALPSSPSPTLAEQGGAGNEGDEQR